MPAPRPTKPLLDFGAIPLTVSPMADVMLLKLPRKSLRHVGDELRGWASKAPITAAKALYYVDADDPDLRYVLLQFLLSPPQTFDIDDQVEYEELITEELARVHTAALETLPEKDKRRILEGLTVGVTWPDDWEYTWGDESAKT
jgi:hypothetical protein